MASSVLQIHDMKATAGRDKGREGGRSATRRHGWHNADGYILPETINGLDQPYKVTQRRPIATTARDKQPERGNEEVP